MKSIIILAYNVHGGGGRTLLESLLLSLDNDVNYTFIVDSRFRKPTSLNEKVQFLEVNPTVLSRVFAEIWLLKNSSKVDLVLCLGNLPPLFRLTSRVYVYVQNRFLVDKVVLYANIKSSIRIFVERLWLLFLKNNADLFLVQTNSMKRLLDSRLTCKVPIEISPFVLESFEFTRRNIESKESRKNNEYDFLYVASGEPHKNHLVLIEAWKILAKEGLFPLLCLTVDCVSFNKLCDVFDHEVTEFGLKIKNVGSLDHTKVLDLYKKSGALIYPSLYESFGLPLIEARQAKISIIASELDYVRDLIDPDESFDPLSANSIAHAVKRYLKVKSNQPRLLSAEEFLDKLWGW